jgi:hypothetical protein
MRRILIGAEERQLLAEALDETPETTIPVPLLRWGLCSAYFGEESAEAATV